MLTGQIKKLTHVRPDDGILIQRLNRDGPERTEILRHRFQSHLTRFDLNNVDDGYGGDRVANEQPRSPSNKARNNIIVVPLRDFLETCILNFVQKNLSQFQIQRQKPRERENLLRNLC